METKRLEKNAEAAAEIIKQGGLVGVPTETVYGLAADGLNADAVARIYAVKGRPENKPVSLMVEGVSALDQYCRNVPEAAYILARAFWPGPVTIVAEAAENVPEIVRGGGKTVALRCPNQPETQALLAACGVPLAAPSANPSGEPSPKMAEDVLKYFDGKIDAVLDGGPCGIGQESTIVDVSQTPYRIIRKGAVPDEDIYQAILSGLTVIGITGGTGSGKTTALDVLQEMDVCVIDCDAVYHYLVTGTDKLEKALPERFGPVFKDGELDRKALGKIVFQDREALAELNRITHGLVNAEVDNILKAYALGGGQAAAIDAIALIESGMSQKCRFTVGIVAPEEERIRRIMEREGISEEYAAMRIRAQKPDHFYTANCDHTLRNDGTKEEFVAACQELFKKMLS